MESADLGGSFSPSSWPLGRNIKHIFLNGLAFNTAWSPKKEKTKERKEIHLGHALPGWEVGSPSWGSMAVAAGKLAMGCPGL